MTSIRVKFRRSSVNGREGTVFFRIVHDRQSRQISLDIHVHEGEWDDRASQVRADDCDDSDRRKYLQCAGRRIRSAMERMQGIVGRLEMSGRPFSARDIVCEFRGETAANGFMAFSQGLIDELARIGKVGTSRRFRTTLNSLRRFHGAAEIEWRHFGSTLICGYEEHMLRSGLCRNTTSYYMRNLRSMYNRAIEQGCDVRQSPNPFRYVYMGVDKTAKRAVSLATVRLIRDVDLSGHPQLEFARNIFMLSFYMRGMSFVDIAYLKKTDMRYGSIVYHRRKTRQLQKVKVESEITRVLDALGRNPTGYMVPVILSTEESAYRQYKSAYYRINRDLKRVGRMIGLDVPLTLYVARHTWASIARTQNVPISIISEAMGHDSESTTRIYLSTLDTSSVDNANSDIIKLLDRNPT